MQFALVGVHICFLVFAKMCERADRVKSKIGKYLYWNGSIRFFMEAYLDFAMFSLLNIKTIDWGDDFIITVASNYISIILLTSTLVIPVIMCFFWAWSYKRWNKEEFIDKYGSLLEGTNMEFEERQWIVMLIPLAYFLRRLALAITCVFFIDLFWGQIALQFATSIAMIILLQYARPLESNFATNLETFNELITLNLLYMILTFSDWVPDEALRSECGKVFIAFVCLYCVVHIYFLLVEAILSIRHSIRRKYYARRNKKLLA